MSDLALFAEFQGRKLISQDGGAVTLPAFVLGDRPVCTLRIIDRPEGDLRDLDIPVRTLHASLGKVLEAPTAGNFTLRVGAVESSELAVGATAPQIEAALIEIIEEVIEVQVATPNCWLARLGFPGPVALTVGQNALAPVSFVRVRAFQQNAEWWHEIRLIQAPLAWNENGFERVLPPSPEVRRIHEGSAGTETEPEVNELQALYVPPTFRGTYFLRWNFRTTRPIGIEDGPEEIAEALNAMFPDGGKRFEATNPEPDNAYIEFGGPLRGQSQPLITVQVNSFPPGVITFELPLDRAELAAALRNVTEIELPLEVELELINEGEDPNDPEVSGRPITLFQQKVKVVREQKWKELGTVAHIDWLRPPAPRDYIPFTPGQIITGQQNYTAVFGNGELRSFSFAHNLGTENISNVTVRENVSGGRLLVLGTDYAITILTGNELVLDVAAGKPTPALNSLGIIITTAGPISAFQAHTHTMAQIIGLDNALAALEARLQAIEDLLPDVTPSLPAENAKGFDFQIPNKSEIYPGRFSASGQISSDLAKLKPGGLLPAIHDATIENAILPLPLAADHIGNVFVNNSGADIVLPGGLGRRSAAVKPGGHYGSDGRVWYRLSHNATTNSFFPTDFERELFMLHINEQQLRAGGMFTIEFELELQLFKSLTSAQYLMVIEAGSVPGQSTPAPVGINLQDIIWLGTPVLSQRIIVTGVALKHHFGCAFKRSIDGSSIAASRLLYDVWQGNSQAPSLPSFALRARLIQFDTENSVTGAKGLVSYRFIDAKAVIENA